MSADNKLLHALYRDMRRVRSLRSGSASSSCADTAGSMLHLSIGEESAAAGITPR